MAEESVLKSLSGQAEEKSMDSKKTSILHLMRSSASTDVENLDVHERWEQKIEAMASRGPCKDLSCTDCRWPRSQNVGINCVTAQAKCPTIAKKFEEHVQLVYYAPALQHVTTTVVGAYLLLVCVILVYTVGETSREYVDTSEIPYSEYPTITILCVGCFAFIDAVLLLFLWATHRRFCEIVRIKMQNRTSNQINLRKNPLGKFAKGIPSVLSKKAYCFDKIYDATHTHMQLFHLACLVPVIFSANICVFFLYFAKSRIQNEFVDLYFFQEDMLVKNLSALTTNISNQCNITSIYYEILFGQEEFAVPAPWDGTNKSLWDGFIGVNSPRNLTDMKSVVTEIQENHVEVATFMFLVGAKLIFLFLMVIHHSGFNYLVAAALLNDATVFVLGLLSISTSYVKDFV